MKSKKPTKQKHEPKPYVPTAADWAWARDVWREAIPKDAGQPSPQK